MELIEELIHAGEGVAVFDGLGIECPVVDAQTEGAISLAGEEDRRSILGAGRPDPALFKVDGELAFKLLNLSWGHAEGALLGWVGVGFEIYAVERAHVGCSAGLREGSMEAMEELVELGLVWGREASGGGEGVRGVKGRRGSGGDVDEVGKGVGVLAEGLSHAGCRDDVACGGGEGGRGVADEVERGRDGVCGPVDGGVDGGEEGLPEDTIISLKGGDHKRARVGEVRGEDDRGVKQLLGCGGDRAISKADEEGLREIDRFQAAMPLDEVRRDKVAACPRVDEEGGLHTVDGDLDCEQLMVEGRWGGEGKDLRRVLRAVIEAAR